MNVKITQNELEELIPCRLLDCEELIEGYIKNFGQSPGKFLAAEIIQQSELRSNGMIEYTEWIVARSNYS